jgi:hypothetical protein
MNLRELAESDLAVTLEDNANGFGWAVTVTDPNGVTNAGPLYGQSTDIGAMLDPETGVLIAGRTATVSLRLSSLTSQGLGTPKATPSASSRPWLVAFNDINGNAFTFKVVRPLPDRSLGFITLILEAFT